MRESFDFRILLMSMPILSSITSMGILLFSMLYDKKEHLRLKLNMLFYFLCVIVTVASMLIFFYDPTIIQKINPLFMWSFMMIPVFLYRFIFCLTRVDIKEHFSAWHYFFPVLLSLSLIVVASFTPVHDQILTIGGDGVYTGGTLPFYFISNGKLFFRLFFSLSYLYCSFKRLKRYKIEIQHFASNESKISLRWVTIYLVFMISLLPIPIYGLFVTRSEMASSGLASVHLFLMVLQHTFITAHIVKGDYLLPLTELEKEKEERSSFFDHERKLKKSFTKTEFENYLIKEKPYRNPDLKISDLVRDIGINRTYISQMINNEYHMNFNHFINDRRNKEFQRIRRIETKMSEEELAETVGFTSLRSYKRYIKKIECGEWQQGEEYSQNPI